MRTKVQTRNMPPEGSEVFKVHGHATLHVSADNVSIKIGVNYRIWCLVYSVLSTVFPLSMKYLPRADTICPRQRVSA